MARLIVFDLDLTLWHCAPLLWCDQLTPPLRRAASGRVFAFCRNEVRLYPGVPDLLARLSATGHLLGLASRTSAPAIARELLDLFGIASFFAHQHIYPGDKSAHFRALHEETGVAFEDMIFFDDEHRNIESVSRLGVAAHLVPHGMNGELLKVALGNPQRNSADELS
jgi:magnesium-dependent phosphatase 1